MFYRKPKEENNPELKFNDDNLTNRLEQPAG